MPSSSSRGDPAGDDQTVPGLVLAGLPLIGLALCAYLMHDLPLQTWYRFVSWLVIGLAVYFGYSRKNSRLRNQSIGKATDAAARLVGSSDPPSAPGLPPPLRLGEIFWAAWTCRRCEFSGEDGLDHRSCGM